MWSRFLKGKLIYGDNENKRELRIADLDNPLEGEFNLSGHEDYFSINMGFRTGKKAENAKKLEIWLTPRFLIERNLETTAGHFKEIMDGWDGVRAPVGIFWTWGSWGELDQYNYLTSNNMDELGSEDLFEKYKKSRVLNPIAEWERSASYAWHGRHGDIPLAYMSHFMFVL